MAIKLNLMRTQVKMYMLLSLHFTYVMQKGVKIG